MCKDIIKAFHKAPSEHTRRLLTNIAPVNNVYPFVQGRKIVREAIAGIQNDRYINFINEGVQSILKTEEEILDVANSIAMFDYKTKDTSFISDIHSGLYTMLTTGEKFIEIIPLYAKEEDGTEIVKSIRIVTKLETIYKAAFGPLVDDNGRAIYDSSEIIQKAKEDFMPIIYGKKPMPRATITLRIPQPDGTTKEAWIKGEPLRIIRATNELRNTIEVELDTEFSPIQISGDKIEIIKNEGQFVRSIAGLTAMLQFGKRLTKEPKEGGIECLTAKKIIMMIQTSAEIQRITGVGIKNDSDGRKSAIIRRNAIRDLIPNIMRYSGTEWEEIDWKKASNNVSKAGIYIQEALTKTEFFDFVDPDHQIYIPATDKAAHFPKEYPNAVFLKIDRSSR